MGKWSVIVLAVLALLIAGYLWYVATVANPRVMAELRANPEGDRAARAMILTFPDGRELPVNYLREGDSVYAGSDGRWWRAFRGQGAPVTVLIRGRTLSGHATVELDDQAVIDDVFSRLRPAASWVPRALDAKLVVIQLDQATDE
jgi:hypothetical protein